MAKKTKRKFRLEKPENQEQFFAVVAYKDKTYDCFNVKTKIRRGLLRILQSEDVPWDFEEKHRDQWYLGKFLYRGGNFFEFLKSETLPLHVMTILPLLVMTIEVIKCRGKLS